MLERDSHERLNELAQLNLTRHRLRSLDHCPDVQPLNSRIDRHAHDRESGFLGEPRMKSLELPYLAEAAPAQIALPRVSQICVGNALHAARRVKPCGYLIGDALVLDEAVLACGLNGPLVQTHGLGVPTFDACDFA